jgi:hypothetical protein
MSDFLDSDLVRSIGLIAAIVTIGALAFVSGVRDLFADAYSARWPVAAALGLALAACAWLALSGRGVRVITKNEELQKELRKTIKSSRKRLVCVGSRSRDRDYLKLILSRISSNNDLRHSRVLCGPPARETLKEHLEKLAGLPEDRVYIGLLSSDKCDEPEQSICVSDRRAVVIVPAFGHFDEYEAGLLITKRTLVRDILSHADSLIGISDRIRIKEITALQTTKPAAVEREIAAP